MNLTIAKEATISSHDATFQLVEEWIETTRTEDLSPGPSVNDSLERAVAARRKIEACGSFEFDDSLETPDLLHALCRILMEQCSQSPRLVLRDARVIRESLEGRPWKFDTLSEREGLLCSLTLICWRACRLLNLTREVQQLWSEYRGYFRNSLDWEVTLQEWGPLDRWRHLRPDELEALGPEILFRMLLQLQEELESDPPAIGFKSLAIYRCLSDSSIFAPDLHSYFQGDAARLVSNALRAAGRYQDASHWLDTAELHACSGVNPDPQLARILYVRLAISYGLTQLEPVLRAARGLDRKLASFGMEEDRIKCRIVWAASLKIAGQPEAALDVLESVRGLAAAVTPQLSGWILAEIGDLHGICGDHERGVQVLQRAAHLLRRDKQLTALAHVNSMIGRICRSRNLLPEAVRLYASSIDDFEQLGLKANAAYARILIAEAYLAMQLPRSAEMEILKALPVLEGQGMLPDALVALSILREAVRRQKLDPQMLQELRERLRPGSQ
jgi:tetratricopeptide (TPR) repeat protein